MRRRENEHAEGKVFRGFFELLVGHGPSEPPSTGATRSALPSTAKNRREISRRGSLDAVGGLSADRPTF